MQYRREIDGLRALAVVPVILFHAGFAVFSGGFVGVDVFFVISGYLITSIIISEQRQGTFTLAGFYERRARRILPALFLVLACTLPFAWMWLLPAEMKSFSESLVAVSAFASNIFFWRTSGYFDSAAELKPLLHTWSLAVEEQYYVFFPLLLMLLAHVSRRWLAGLLAAAALASLALAQLRVVVSPAATFYLLPTRGWELLIGALIALFLSRGKLAPRPRWVDELLAGAGLLLIAVAIFAFDRQTPFPSVYTLVPTVGAGLIILFAQPATGVGKLLGSRGFVGIGLISYSAYLWHQPILALARQQALAEPPRWEMAGFAVASLVLAFLSWRFVERPFRARARFGRREILGLGLAGSLFFAAFGLAGVRSGGFDSRMTPEQSAYLAYFENASPGWQYLMRTGMLEKYRTECDFYDLPKYRVGYSTRKPLETIAPSCYRRDPAAAHAVFLWGDSHAQQLYAGLKQVLPPQWQILQVASSGCVPRLGAKPSPNDYCDTNNAFAWNAIAQSRPDVVLVAQNLGHSLADMARTAAALRALGVPRVVFTGPSPHWTSDLPNIVVRKLWNDASPRTWTGVDLDVLRAGDAVAAGFPQSDAVRFVSISDYFCNSQGCLTYLGPDRREGITSFDHGHLTPIASTAFARDVLAAQITNGFP
jgi:peptidoglycan/LPS O-acetylase OafA/YrhL